MWNPFSAREARRQFRGICAKFLGIFATFFVKSTPRLVDDEVFPGRFIVICAILIVDKLKDAEGC